MQRLRARDRPSRPPPRVALATYRGAETPLAEDRVLALALRRRGVDVAHPVWNDDAVDWSQFRMVVVRSTWDYHHQRAEFLRWVRRVGALVDLWNRPATLRWNTDKGYLTGLGRKGVPVVPTAWVRRGQTVQLEQLLDRRGWSSFVLKPAVSAAGDETYRFRRSQVRSAQRELRRLTARGTAMVQPYYASVETIGERSLVYIGGRFSHAVRRVPLFPRRTRRSRETIVDAPAALRRVAADTLAACPEPVLYARVDLVADDVGTWRLLELEVTEPSLFFVPCPEAADRLAAEIVRRLDR